MNDQRVVVVADHIATNFDVASNIGTYIVVVLASMTFPTHRRRTFRRGTRIDHCYYCAYHPSLAKRRTVQARLAHRHVSFLVGDKMSGIGLVTGVLAEATGDPRRN